MVLALAGDSTMTSDLPKTTLLSRISPRGSLIFDKYRRLSNPGRFGRPGAASGRHETLAGKLHQQAPQFQLEQRREKRSRREPGGALQAAEIDPARRRERAQDRPLRRVERRVRPRRRGPPRALAAGNTAIPPRPPVTLH